jgi:hypothetical protein
VGLLFDFKECSGDAPLGGLGGHIEMGVGDRYLSGH